MAPVGRFVAVGDISSRPNVEADETIRHDKGRVADDKADTQADALRLLLTLSCKP